MKKFIRGLLSGYFFVLLALLLEIGVIIFVQFFLDDIIIEAVGKPLISTSVRTLDEERESEYVTDPELIYELFAKHVDIVVDGGIGEDIPSTVVDCSGGKLEIIRQGKGEIEL